MSVTSRTDPSEVRDLLAYRGDFAPATTEFGREAWNTWPAEWRTFLHGPRGFGLRPRFGWARVAGRESLIELARRERGSWLNAVSEPAASAVVVATEQSVEFYTTEWKHLRAIRPVLQPLIQHMRSHSAYCKMRVVEQTGPRASRRLMNFAAGLTADAIRGSARCI